MSPGNVSRRIPGFFIVGAPKCGTSTLYQMLREHPRIYLPPSKMEPHFFASDIALHRRHPDLASYLRLFSDAPEDAVIGEASTWYLYSKVAVRNILAFNPDARLIVMLRNPVDMAHSMHSFNLVKFHEDVSDFSTAWSLQKERSLGRCLPSGLPDAAFVQYFDACALADDVERLLGLARPEQVQVHIFEDFFADPATAMDRTWRFLGVDSVPTISVPRVNPNRRWRQPWLARLMARPPRPLSAIYAPAKRLANRLGLNPGQALHRLNEAPARRLPMPGSLRSELLSAFGQNNQRLREMLGHPLDAWRS